MTIRSQLEGVYKKTKNKPKLLEDEIMIPQMYKQVYLVFIELRSQDINSNISHTQLLTYQQLFDINFLRFEVDIFSNLDLIFNKVMKKRK